MDAFLTDTDMHYSEVAPVCLSRVATLQWPEPTR